MMGSMFDSRVYERRRANEWASISLLSFAHDVSGNGWGVDDADKDESVVLTIAPRPDVATRFWYSISWLAADGTRRQVSSQEFGLLMWRAAVSEEDIRFEMNSKAGHFVVSVWGARKVEDKVFEKRIKAHMAAVELSSADKATIFEVWNQDADETLVLVRDGRSFT